MNITLGKEFERRITEKVSDGLYPIIQHLHFLYLAIHRYCCLCLVFLLVSALY